MAVRGSSRRSVPCVAPLEVALELPRDRLAGGLGQLGGVAGLLEGTDVLGDVLVLLRQLVDAKLHGAGVIGAVAGRDDGLGQVLELGQERDGGLWGWRTV